MNVVVLGALLWDVFDDKKRIGGAPFNVAAHATKLGFQTAFISAVGDDELGQEALAHVMQLGLNTKYIRTVKDMPTGSVRVFLKDGQPDYDINRPAAYDHTTLSDTDIQHLADTNPQWLYFGTLEQMSPMTMSVLQRLLTAIPEARRFYDVNLRKESYTPLLIERLLTDTTVLKINDNEADALADMFSMGNKRDEAFCKAIATRFDLECVCITRGENGCVIWQGKCFVESSGHAISLADAVGAGDAFSAALMYGLTMEWDLHRVAAFANKMGALVASRHGAVPQWALEEVL